MFLAKRLCRGVSVTPGLRPAMSRGFATEGKEEEKKGELVHHVRDAVAARSMAGTPEMLEKRVAKISRPCKNAMQSGTGNTHKWRVQFLSNGRWENPLMGWASTADPLGYLTIDFETEEQAVRFCDDQGFKYTVQEPRPYVRPNQSYAGNFPYVGGTPKNEIGNDFW